MNESESKSEAILPQEIIMEILSWLPLKPLVRSQLVCKEWQALILPHKFMEKHMKRSKCIHQFYNVLMGSTVNTLHGVDNNSFCYLHGLDGLILLLNRTLHKCILWNPAARRILELPDPLGYSYGLALSVIPSTTSYGTVSFYRDKESTLLRCQLLNLGETLAWRQLTFPLSYIVTEDAELKVVSLGRAVHCVVRNKIVVEIITLDVETEIFTLTRIPTGIFRDLQSVITLDWKGKLAFCDIVGEDMELMVLEDYKEQKWCREKEVIPLPFLEDEDFKGKKVRALLGKDGEIWFHLEGEKIFTYTIKTRKTLDIKEERHFSFSADLCEYKPNFITYKGMQSDEELDFCRPRLWYD